MNCMMENNMNSVPVLKTEEEPRVPSLEKKTHTELTPEEMERGEFEVKRWIENHPVEEVPMEMRIEYSEEIKEQVEAVFAEFEKIHPLENLHAITELTPELIAVFEKDPAMESEQIAAALENLPPEDVEKYKTRIAARNDLGSIYTLLKALQVRTKISESEYEELKTASKVLSRAVGMINRGKIDHTR